MSPDAHKVLIYATWQGHLLVFDEPDFPEINCRCPVVRWSRARARK